MANRIRENITEQLHQQIQTYLAGDTKLYPNSKQNIKVATTILFYCGIRLNEITQMTIGDLKTIISKKELIIKIHKQKRERKLFFSNAAVKEIKKLFDYKNENDDSFIIRAKGQLDKAPHKATFINSINKFIQKALNSDRYSSHSYRAGLITQMAKSINTKFISQYIGHSDTKTTMRYIRATDTDLRECIIR